MNFLFLLILTRICSAYFKEGDLVMFPNERTTLDDCHLRYFRLNYGFVGPPFGTAARFREFSHMAAIGWTDLNNETGIQWQCGGSLIWDNFVLTAAHCTVDARNRAPDVVRLGDLDLFSEGDDKHAQQFGIAEIIRHPGHRFAARYHDIALLKLDKNVRFDLTVSPACLWADEEVRFPTLTATGWGNTGYGMKRTPNLLKVTLKPIDNKQCSEVYPSDRKLRSGLKAQHICAVDEKMDTCEGDSGGPLQVKLMHNSRLSSFLVGITSFGVTCGASHPGVYTRVSFYHEWIVSTMRAHGAVDLQENYNATFCALKFAEFREFDPYVIRNQTDSEVLIDSERQRIYEMYKTPEQMVKLEWNGTGSDCYGVIIDEDTVLTVADCTESQGKPPSHITYLQTKTMEISSIHVHPNYYRRFSYNNIAILKMSQLLELPLDFQPSCIWHERNFPGSRINAYGMGRRDMNEFGSSKLDPRETIHLIKSPVQNATSCILSKSFHHQLPYGLSREHFCVGNDVFLVPGSCSQLSGSIFDSKLYKENNDYHHTMALSLLGRDCGFGEHLIGVRLASHVEWMKSVLLPRYEDVAGILRYRDPDLQEGDVCGIRGRCVSMERCSVPRRRLDTFCSNSSVVCCPIDRVWTKKPDKIRSHIHNCPNIVRRLPRTSKIGAVVQIGWVSNQTTHYYCSGAILNEVTILSTASCIGTDPPHVVVHDHTPYVYRIESILKHPLYNSTDKSNDLALLQLKNPLSWSSVVFPVCLWTNTTHLPIVMKMMYPDEADDFQLVTVHPMYNSDCQRTHPYRMRDSQLCVRNPARNTTCTSSFDQLIWTDPKGVTFLVGLTPDAGECVGWRYSVLTRVSSYLEWIEDNTM